MASGEREPITGVWTRSDPPYPPVKTSRILSISGATSSKSGTQSTPWRRHCLLEYIVNVIHVTLDNER